MESFTMNITFVTDGHPTDLELEDMMVQITDCLQYPVVETIDGGSIPADYSTVSYVAEIFDSDGERIWRYANTHDNDDLIELEHLLSFTTQRKIKRTTWFRVKKYLNEMKQFFRS
jgi:hypothetical protein